MSGTISIENLGFTKAELLERVIDRMAEQAMSGQSWNEDGEEIKTDSFFARKLQERIEEQVEASINALAEKHVLPNVAQYVENLTMQQTNKWGEKRGEPVTFIEYLTQRAEAYLTEKVNYEGKAPGEGYGGGGQYTQTRITHLVEKHLHYSISTAMQKALDSANSAITEGIYETVKIKLAEFAAALKVSVVTEAKRK